MGKIKRRGNFKNISDFVKSNVGNLNSFINPVENPFIRNIEEAVLCIHKNKTKKFAVVGDYDVDGMASTWILGNGLTRFLGEKPYLRIPHRFQEGYGISPSIVDEIQNYFANEKVVLLTCDNGIAAYDAIEKAKKYGMTVILTDHHLPAKNKNGDMILPPADIIIDPHTDDSHYINYCGAGLAYRLISCLLNEKCENALVVAGLATVADMVPLIGANRYLVQESLRLLRAGKAPAGLLVLKDKMNITVPYEDDYGYRIGPCFNALSRLTEMNHNDADIAIQLLNADAITAEPIAEMMINRNNHRKELSAEGVDLVKAQIDDTRPIVFSDKNIHPGIIGLIAGELCQTYHCPVIIFTEKEDGTCIGSARSIPGWHIKNILDKTKQYLIRYGGHEGAAGLTLKKENLRIFKESFIKICNEVGELPPITEDTFYEIEASITDIPKLKEEYDRYAPYGIGNPQPEICVKIPPLTTSNMLCYMGKPKAVHFKVIEPGFSIIAFHRVGDLNKLPPMTENEYLFAGKFSDNWYRGNHSTQILVDEFEPQNKRI